MCRIKKTNKHSAANRFSEMYTPSENTKHLNTWNMCRSTTLSQNIWGTDRRSKTIPHHFETHVTVKYEWAS